MDQQQVNSVMVTGATGFVGRHVVRELTRRGVRAVCLTRSVPQLHSLHSAATRDRLVPVLGTLFDRDALQQAADQSQAVIHLVGIIINRRLKGKTFHRVHVTGTQRVLEATERAGIGRFVHMSALGTRADATSNYHRTKWQAEQNVRSSSLNTTVFRPSVIHGAEGEFMRLMKAFVTGFVPPVIPYFGDGSGRLQPVDVRDVAACMVESALREDQNDLLLPMGGPTAYSWKKLYRTCQRLIPGARTNKPLASLPVPMAKLAAVASGPPLALLELLPGLSTLGKFRFDTGQVEMAQEDATCDHTIVEKAFDIRLRSFEQELAIYGDRIR